MCTSYFSGSLEEKKYSNCVRIYFSCFIKVRNTQNTQYSKTIYWFTIDSSVLLNEGVQFFFSWHLSLFCFYCWFYKIIWKDYIRCSLNISTHLSMKKILVDPNLVRTLLVYLRYWPLFRQGFLFQNTFSFLHSCAET